MGRSARGWCPTTLPMVATAVLAQVVAAAAMSLAAAAAADPGAPAPVDPTVPVPVDAMVPAAGDPAVPPGVVAAPPVAPPSPSGPIIPGIGVPLGPYGLGVPPGTAGLDPTTVLGQQPVPSPPGAGPGTPPGLSIFNNAYTPLPQYVEPSAPGEGVQFSVEPGEENADIGRLEWFGRFADLYRDGRLKGGLLGQMPEAQLGQPLPGTAPPPGTNIPPGLVEFLPDPAAAPVPPGEPLPLR